MRELTPITGSSTINGYAYDDAAKHLTMSFIGGAVYEYPNVPPDIMAEFREAPSKGRFFHQHIRHTYAAIRVDGDHGQQPLIDILAECALAFAEIERLRDGESFRATVGDLPQRVRQLLAARGRP